MTQELLFGGFDPSKECSRDARAKLDLGQLEAMIAFYEGEL